VEFDLVSEAMRRPAAHYTRTSDSRRSVFAVRIRFCSFGFAVWVSAV
jgi:hypothetical protein